jgi:geranylgeranyl diphosphate synthase, type II
VKPTLLVAELLTEYGALADEALQVYLQRVRPLRRHHDAVCDYPRRGGRRMRASLCIAAARAFGACTQSALKTAVSLELLHNAFLVHDDIEDASEARRGAPTLHIRHGLPIAVNAGDALAVLALSPLIDNAKQIGPTLSLALLADVQRMATETVEGQAMELAWRQENELTLHEEDYLLMVLKKTCWYSTIFPCRSGALLGCRSNHDLDRFLRYGFFLGAAFQIQDDLLNLVALEAQHGKDACGDLFEGKRTLMLIHVLKHASPEQRCQIGHLLRRTREERTPEDVAMLRKCMTSFGSLSYARRFAHTMAGAALHEFERAFALAPPSRDREFLKALPYWVIDRS